MTTETLPFAKLDFIDRRIVIIEIRDGVEELDREMVAKLGALCRERCDFPYVVISNKRASYSVSFEAAQEIIGIDEVAELISVIPDSTTRTSLHWFSKMHPHFRFADTLEEAIEQARRLLDDSTNPIG